MNIGIEDLIRRRRFSAPGFTIGQKPAGPAVLINVNAMIVYMLADPYEGMLSNADARTVRKPIERGGLTSFGSASDPSAKGHRLWQASERSPWNPGQSPAH